MRYFSISNEVGVRFMKFLRSSLVGLVLAFGGCGSGGGPGDYAGSGLVTGGLISTEPPALTDFHIRDPEYTESSEPPVNQNQWGFSVRYQGADILDHWITHDHSQSLGYGPLAEVPEAQRGNGRGSVFFRRGNNFGSLIDTRLTPFRRLEGTGPHVALTYSFQVKPRIVDLPIIRATLSHWVGQNQGGVEQLSIIGYLSDLARGETIGFVWSVMDNRWDWYEPQVQHDTSVYFVSQPIHATRYATNLEPTAMRRGPFRDLTVEMVITPENMKNIIDDANRSAGGERFSRDISQYRLDSFGVLHEVFIFNDPNNWVRSGVSWRDVSAHWPK